MFVNIPSAPVRTFIVAGTEYRGANPKYHNIAEAGQPANFVKVAKGVPWKRVGDKKPGI